MIRRLLWSAAMVAALASPAYAQDQCVAPKAPPIPDGTKATQTQIVAAQNDIKAFAAASDNFQSCVAQELDRQKALAKEKNVELDPGIQTALEEKGSTQKNDVMRIATAWGAAIDAYTKAQARKQRQPSTAAPTGGSYGSGTRY